MTAWLGLGVGRSSAASASPRAGEALPASQSAPMAPAGALRRIDDHVRVQDYGAVADGVADDLAAILRAAIASRTGQNDGIGRAVAGEIKLPPGRYRITGPLDLAPAAGVVGLTISGAGAGTEIIFDGSTATIRCSGGRAVTFRDLAFRSSQGVDANQAAFTISQTGNPLRSWKFERCEFAAFYRCFVVTGSWMASEFYFDKCQFSQCYYLLDNNNEQAVNWNFVNCNWENGELSTKRDVRLASAFWLKRGTFVKWTGGSMIFLGRLVFYQLEVAGSVQRPAHMIAFDGVRIELEDEGGAHVPFVDRIDAHYVSGTNQPTTTFRDCTILHRGAIPSAVIYARAWAHCSLTFENCKARGGRIVGVVDGVTATHSANIRLDNTKSITYEEDVRARVNTHDQHSVTITPDNSGAGVEAVVEQRLCSLAAPATVHPKYMYVRGPSGSLPQGGTSVALIPLPDHTMLMRIVIRRFQAAGHALTVELRDQADTTSYGQATLRAGADRFAEGDIGLEMGFQIPSGTPLMLKFAGAPEVIKGVVGIEYL
ncbi:hypothetical protein [Sphingomonas sp. KR3-1]|uniref:hypothetical protein n=1 Tax=Sphingomonas sp. KR3-1 TaxID=3156611 RepID=UPI0032B4E68A